jgi:hypothetical protein
MYEQDFEQEYHEFHSAVGLFAYISKFRDKALVEICEHTLLMILGSKYTTNVMNAAMFELAESAPETCQWIWQNFPEHEACISLKEYFIMLAIQQLVSQGFVLGQDFSATTHGTLLINENAKLALIQSFSHQYLLLLEELIQVNEQVVLY